MPLRSNDVVQECFGAGFYDQGRGFNVGLELLALARGTLLATNEVLPPDDSESAVALVRHSHDFARRLPYRGGDTPLFRVEDLAHLKGEATPETLQSLVETLTVPVVGRRIIKFNQRMLLPYYGELIHYDAVERRRQEEWTVSIERYTFRGPGGLAHKILRTDVNHERREANRVGLTRLVENSNSPLGRLALALQAHDVAKPTTPPFRDVEERETDPHWGDSPWPGVLCDGVRNIVSRGDDLPRCVDRLLHFVPYCMARHQLALASAAVKADDLSLPVQIGARGSGALRRQSQEMLAECQQRIKDGLLETVRTMPLKDGQGEDEREEFERNINERTKSPRGFFTQTLAAVGALNAPTGLRHLTLKPPLLDALVASMLPPSGERVFEDLCEILDGKLGIVVDDAAASRRGFTTDVNAAEFQQNAAALARDLATLGLLTAYSDATRMVRGEVHH